eukprot:TRINITY_DN10493_c0_g1_i1.p1 TRINITY_DN10493_c0_g1~~TRINITY_DN10493_c0_g1_i1.p1  ORF type:complete len:257 (-),score=27.46 TRINITY_DN10493_c0_g1_i1:47-733(-)
MDEFISEISVLKKLHHPNIVLFMGVCTSPPNLCIVTEFVDQGSMWDVLHNPRIQLNWNRIMKMAIDTARGMSYLHLFKPPIIHRDLKSANLLVDSGFTVKIADFGLSKTKALMGQMTGGTGTPGYMAPEIIKNLNYSEKIDSYAFGVVLWELVTRQAPYSGIQPMQILYGVVHQGLRPPLPPSIPPPLAHLMMICWHEIPDTRPNFEEIYKQLKNFEMQASSMRGWSK